MPGGRGPSPPLLCTALTACLPSWWAVPRSIALRRVAAEASTPPSTTRSIDHRGSAPGVRPPVAFTPLGRPVPPADLRDLVSRFDPVRTATALACGPSALDRPSSPATTTTDTSNRWRPMKAPVCSPCRRPGSCLGAVTRSFLSARSHRHRPGDRSVRFGVPSTHPAIVAFRVRGIILPPNQRGQEVFRNPQGCPQTFFVVPRVAGRCPPVVHDEPTGSRWPRAGRAGSAQPVETTS